MINSFRRRRPRDLPARYCGIDALGEQPHVVVDGADRPSSTLVLSHWPRSSSPARFARDLSTEIVFAYCASRRNLARNATLVTCDHFDEDGLASLFTYIDPERAFGRKALITAFARAGDFGVIEDLLIARALLFLEACCDPDRSPFAGEISGEDLTGNARTARLYEALLPRFFEILESGEHHRDLIAKGEEEYLGDLRAIDSGAVVIEEVDDLGLAIVRATARAGKPIHPWALHSRTALPRVLFLNPEAPWYYDRYETWVRFVSRKLPMRRDLAPLAARLSAGEPRGATWHAEAPSAIVPHLAPAPKTASALAVARIEELVVGYLREAPPAWDPFATRRAS